MNELKNIKEIDVIYLNEHALKNIKERFDIKNIRIQKELELEIYLQKYKNGKIINKFKGVFKVSNFYFIFNLYKNNNKYFIKILTILNEKQFLLSKNFNFGEKLDLKIKVAWKNIERKNKYFDNTYEDLFLNLNYEKLKNKIIYNYKKSSKNEFEKSKNKIIAETNYIKVKVNGETYIIGKG